tara:strand:+ start:568 stop:1407 length:840 start_codon:yes stop_codon:yes gene_type:complete
MTTQVSANPLHSHFRQPAIYLKLPTSGKYWPEDSINLPDSGEIPVYSMTAKDEILLKTPDALMNGEGIVGVIQSCVPNILDPWQIPISDLDSILIAIRLASYGQEMDITSTCPECKEQNENVVDLNMLLDTLPAPTYPAKVYGKLTVQFKPQNFKSLNLTNLAVFEQQSLLASISSSTLTDEQKQAEFKKLLPKITNLTIQTLIDAIESITPEGGEAVVDRAFIREFIDNCDRKTYEDCKAQIEKTAQANKTQPLSIECSACQKAYKSPLSFENSNFFV